MQVNSIRVSFLREKQPAIYEKAQPLVEFAAVLDDGEDHLAAARKLMLDAATVVYAGIGYPVPDKVAAQLASGEVPEGGTLSAQATSKNKVKAGPCGEQELPLEAETPAEEKPKKTRGRPKGSKNTQPKADSKAAEKLTETVAAASTKGRNITDNPEDRVDPSDDIPDDLTATEDKKDVQKEPSDALYGGDDLHKDLMAAVKDGELTGPHARQILAPFKAARARDLTPEQAGQAKKMLDQMLKSE